MGVDVDVALKYAQLSLGALRKKAPTILASALNDGVTTMRMEGKKIVNDRYTLANKVVNQSVKLWKANRNDLSASVTAKSERIHLVDFKVTPKKMQHKEKDKKMITVEVIKGQAKPIYGFIAPGQKSGKLIVFRRSRNKPSKRIRLNGITEDGKKTNSERPIEAMRGPSIPEMMNRKEVRVVMERIGQEKFENRLEHEINRILKVKDD